MHSCSENEPLYLCKTWAEDSYAVAAPNSQRISELLLKLDEDSRMKFYKKWAAHLLEIEYIALDITSISSWSELIKYVEHGYNRDKEKLPQINLAMFFGEDSKLPVFSRLYPGSIKDVSTLSNMFTFIFVFDKGFYSEHSILKILKNHTKFAVGMPLSVNKACELVDKYRSSICQPDNAIKVGDKIYDTLMHTDRLADERIYYHIFYDEQRYLNDKNKLINKVMSIENNMFEDGIISKDRKYFVIDNEKCEMYRSSDAFKSELKHSGFFVIMTNHYKCSDKELRTKVRCKD